MDKEKVILFIVVSLIVLTTIVSLVLNNDNKIEHNGVTIREQDYIAIQEKFGDSLFMKVCNLDNYNCILLTNLDKAMEEGK